MIKREDYNVMNSKKPEKSPSIEKAFINKNNDLVLVNEGKGIYIPTSSTTFLNSLQELDSKFFTEEFVDGVRNKAWGKVLKSDLRFIKNSIKDEEEASNKVYEITKYEITKKSAEVEALLLVKQKERNLTLNQKAINTFVNAFNSMSKTTSKQSDNIETK